MASILALEALEADQECLSWIQAEPRSRLLSVKALYSHALYAEVESRIIVLLSQEEPVGPSGVVVSTTEFDSTWQQTGMVLGDTLHIGPRVIALGRARAYDSTLISRNHYDLDALIWMVAQVWGQDDIFSHVSDGALRYRVRKALGTLLEGLDGHNYGGVADTVGSLIGLGSGSTPTGDDMLVGFIAGLSLSHPLWAQRMRGAIPSFESLCLATTLPSAVALAEVSHGRAFSLIHDGLRWLSAPTPGDHAWIARLAQRGHTSGKDIMAGMVIGTRAHL